MKESLINNFIKYWYLPLAAGILYLFLGIWVFASPLSTFLGLSILLSAGICTCGFFELAYGILNRKRLAGWKGHFVGGALNLCFGLLLIANPGLTAFMLAILIGIWLSIKSVMCIIQALENKRLGTKKWKWALVSGISGLVVSMLLLWLPSLTGITVSLLIGIGLLIVGTLHIIISIAVLNIKKSVDGLKERFDDYEDLS